MDSDEAIQPNKYVCGCGKEYGSYPAFSTHRKQKHNNETIQGTIIPKINNSKRGRPSCQFQTLPKLSSFLKNYYDGLTTIELGLLNLDLKFGGKVLRTHLNDFTLPTNNTLISYKCVIKFIQLITIHMEDQPAKIVVNLFEQLTQLNEKKAQFEALTLNKYFDEQKIKKQDQFFGKEFKIEVILLMGEWMNKIGEWNLVIRQKDKNI